MWNMSLLMGNAQPFILQIITIKQTPRGQPPSAYLFRKVNSLARPALVRSGWRLALSLGD